jgi:hypothetical protein
LAALVTTIFAGAAATAALGQTAAETPAAAPETPATAAAEPAIQIAEVREQTMPGFQFCHVSENASVAKIGQAIGKLMPKLERALKDGGLKPAGNVIFIYRGVPEAFTLEVGVPVAEGAVAPEGFAIRKVEPFRCLTTLYSGPMARMREAYERVMGEVFMRGEPLPEWRESYLYHEGASSPNNVTHIQVGIK